MATAEATALAGTSSGGLSLPQLVAVFPTAVVLQWQPPSPRGDRSGSNADRSLWQYTVEWSCACTAHAGQPNRLTTTDCWLVLKRQHPCDDIHVRVVAKQECEEMSVSRTSSTRTTSSHITLSAAKLEEESLATTPLPWLQDDALSHTCLFDALFLSLHTTSALASMPPSRREHLQLSVKGVQALRGIPFSLITATYGTARAPFETARVVYYVACSIPSRRDIEQITPAQVVQGVEGYAEHAVTAVFCGFGDLAANAIDATRAVLVEAERQGRARLCRRVLCTSYGAAEHVWRQSPLSSVRHAGHFLLYELPTSPVSPLSAVSRATTFTPPVACPTGVQTAPLNIVCGVRAKLARHCHPTGPWQIEGVAPQVCPEPSVPCAPSTVGTGLAEVVRLRTVVLPQASALLDPVISSVDAEVGEEDATIALVVRGHNLHYSPLMCAVQEPHGAVLSMSVESEAPHMLIGKGSLLACLCTAHALDREVGTPRRVFDSTVLALAVNTAVGRCTMTSPSVVSVDIPFSVARLAWLGSIACAPALSFRRPSSRVLWLVDFPAVFLSNVLLLQPLQYSTPAALRATSRCTVGLCHLSSCAELARHYMQKTANNPLLSFLSNVAAKVGPTGAGRRREGMEPLTLEVPQAMESAYFMTALGHGVQGSRHDMSSFRDRSRSWLQRTQATLVWLNDAELFERKLLALLHVFAAQDAFVPSTDQPSGQPYATARDTWEAKPLVALEHYLYARISQSLRLTSAPGAAHQAQGTITETLSFETFYCAVHSRLLAAVPASHPANDQLAAAIVLEAVAAWSFCVLYEMRCDAALNHTAVVVADRREDANAVAQSLRSGWEETLSVTGRDKAASRPRLHVKCVVREDVTTLSEALNQNLLDSLFVVGMSQEYADGTIAAVLRSLEASAGPQRGCMQRCEWHCLLIDDGAWLVKALDSALTAPAEAPPVRAVTDQRFWETTMAENVPQRGTAYAEAPVVITLAPPSEAVRACLDRHVMEAAVTDGTLTAVTAAMQGHCKRVLQKCLSQDVILEEM